MWTPRRYACSALVCAVIAVNLSGCHGTAMRAPVGAYGSAHRSGTSYHVVQKGETLSRIAWRYGVDYRRIAAWNHISKPYIIYPGQRLKIRGPRHPRYQSAPATINNYPSKPPAPRAKKQPGRKVITHRPGRTQKNYTVPEKLVWQWPTRGKLGSPAPGSTSKGVDINGTLGQPIYAAANGRVVYSGSGLRGYGKLIIIKHNQHYLSAYAHNDKLLVTDGDRVRKGQQIAEMGRTGTDRAKLHFQIRHDGKPVDPMRYLPK